MTRSVTVAELSTGYNPAAFKHIFPLLRFQQNPYCSHILCEDIISCKINENGGIEMKTYLDKNNKIPKAFEWAWPKNVSKRVRFIEELRLDYCLETPILTHLSRNISVRNVMTTHERAWFRFRKSENNGVGGVDVTVEKEFLCDSFLNGPFGTTAAVRSALRGFGFWRYTEWFCWNFGF